MDPFAADTFLCLDLPLPIADQVLAIRRSYGDAFRAGLPAEITVAGSGGLGVIARGQDPHSVFANLDRAASMTPPIPATFGPVIRFPRTDIFVLTLVDETPLRALQQLLATSSIRFQPNPYPFTPHCTLSSRSPISVEEATALLSLRIMEPFMFETLSAYALMGVPMTRLHAVPLGGRGHSPS